MRSNVLAVAFGLTQLAAGAHVGRRAGHRHGHGHLHARDYDATIIETLVEYTTEYVYDDGSPATPTTSSTPSTSTLLSTSSSSSKSKSTSSTAPSTSLAPAVFIEKSSSSSSIASTTSAPKVSTSPPAPSTTASPTTLASVSVPAVSVTSAAPIIIAAPAPAASSVVVSEKAGERVFVVVNKHTNAIATVHDSTEGTPTSAGQPVAPGTMAPGATATFAVSEGWIGNIGINDAAFGVNSDSTLIEGNYVAWPGASGPVADFDISFVNGFTLPATCSCNGVVTTGCNIDLHAQASCALGIQDNACANPLRASFTATKASSFFAACQGLAWTFVNDDSANSVCASGLPIVCCVGTACPPHPDQA